MSGTVDSRQDETSAVSEPADPAEVVETAVVEAPPPSRADRRRAASEERARLKAERRAARRGETTTARAATIDVRIDPGDPLLQFLQHAPGPLELGVLPDNSPAVARLAEQGATMVVPLITSGELVGVLALGPRLSERTYTRNDRRLLDSLARFAAPALRLGQLMREQETEATERERMQQELHVAQLIQQQFLPSELPELGGWHVAAFYRPARTVGGDFYDVIELGEGRVMVVAGDVTDKGVPAALVMASTYALLRSASEVTQSPSEVLRRVNELLIPQIPMNMFVTCQVLVIDLETGRTQFANAGHNLPYIHRNGRAVELTARGMPLGLLPGSTYEEVETEIEKGDVVLLYSDGITEQHDANGEMFGFGRTLDIVAASPSGEELVDRSVEALSRFSAGVEQEDDITLVALHRGRASGYADTVQFSVPSALGNERDVMNRVLTILEGALPEDRLADLGTAVSETAMNAIEHGNRGDENLEVGVTVRRNSERVTVEIADFGRGATEPEAPDLELKLAGLQTPRGWGMFLVEKLTDRVEDYADGDRHVVRLVMHTSEQADTEGELR